MIIAPLRGSCVSAFLAFAGLIFCGVFSALAQDETFLLDTPNNMGEIVVFNGPDDLNLDPSTVVIAVDCFGDDDIEVNGVTFIADKTDDNAVGEAEANGVTVTTTAANQIDSWSAGTIFEGADQDSADNLSIVMESIRWNGAPNPISIEIKGLKPGTSYEVQLLTNEGRSRYRAWDVTVEDTLVADNINLGRPAQRRRMGWHQQRRLCRTVRCTGRRNSQHRNGARSWWRPTRWNRQQPDPKCDRCPYYFKGRTGSDH